MSSNTEADVKQLKEQVRKLQILLAQTGEQVMELQIKMRKIGIEELGAKTEELHALVPASKPKSSEFVKESDLNEMVAELQGQLALLDDRSILRVLNSRSKSELYPLPNADAEKHANFPKTIQELQSLSDSSLFEQWNHFEMLESETLDDLLDKSTSEEAVAGNKKLVQEMYESFASNVGVNPSEFPRKI